MAIPVFDSSGAAASGAGSTLAVDYPATVNSGDVLIFTYTVESTTAPDTPSGFTLVDSTTTGLGDTVGTYVWWKVAAGTESGSETITKNVSVDSIGRMHRFTGADSEEASATSADRSKTIDHADVTTTGSDRLAIAVTGVNADESAASFTGETGGDFTLDVDDLGTDIKISMQTADMSSSGTISGGTWTYTGGFAEWATIAFAIYDSAAAGLSIPVAFNHYARRRRG